MDVNNRHCFVQGIAQLQFYQTSFGNLDIPDDYITPDRFPLGEFARDIRAAYQDGILKKEHEERLRNIGFAMGQEDQAWESMFVMAKKYAAAHEGRLPRATERTEDGVLLGAWVRKQRLTAHTLGHEKRERLEAIGIMG